jgi:hypothetical protein
MNVCYTRWKWSSLLYTGALALLTTPWETRASLSGLNLLLGYGFKQIILYISCTKLVTKIFRLWHHWDKFRGKMMITVMKKKIIIIIIIIILSNVKHIKIVLLQPVFYFLALTMQHIIKSWRMENSSTPTRCYSLWFLFIISPRISNGTWCLAYTLYEG